MNNGNLLDQPMSTNAGSRHPWIQALNAEFKLKAARAIAARRRELKWQKENRDELSRLLDAARKRKRYRKKLGLSLDTPKAKPHELKKLLNGSGRPTNEPQYRHD